MSFGDIEVKSSGLFLKLQAGQPATIRLLQESPISQMLHGWGKTTAVCGGKNCLTCLSTDDETKKVRQRFKINIYSYESQKVMIFEFGISVINQLKTLEKNLSAQGVKITDVDIIVDASGEKEQRKYQITPMIKSKEIPVGLVLHSLVEDVPF